jgi:septal ring factor EnvC (AmiA/AmiB activator)
MAAASDFTQRISDHLSAINGLLGQFQEAMRTHGEEAKQYPDIRAKLAAAKEELATLTAEVERQTAALAKVQADKAKLLKQLS